MFHIYFLGSSEGLVFDVANANFDAALWNPLREYLESLGVAVPHRRRRRRRAARADASRCTAIRARFDADGVVLATDVAGLRRIVDGSPALGDDDWRARVAALRTAPPFVVLRLWLDRPVEPRPAALPRHRRASTAGQHQRAGALRTRRRPTWARRTGGSVVELHAYAVDDAPDDVRDRLLERLHELYPETARRAHRRRTDAAPRGLPAVRAGRLRRPARRGDTAPGLVLAGDGIRIDLPVALMERAATTGWAAANLLLEHFGVRGHVCTPFPPRAVRRCCDGSPHREKGC